MAPVLQFLWNVDVSFCLSRFHTVWCPVPSPESSTVPSTLNARWNKKCSAYNIACVNKCQFCIASRLYLRYAHTLQVENTDSYMQFRKPCTEEMLHSHNSCSEIRQKRLYYSELKQLNWPQTACTVFHIIFFISFTKKTKDLFRTSTGVARIKKPT